VRVLVVGSGGREHALAWKLARSESVEAVFALPGNPGIAEIAETVSGDAASPDHIVRACEENHIDLGVIGPERPLIAGAADALRDRGIPVFGPTAECAKIEGSKAFAKALMDEVGVPTAAWARFDEFAAAEQYIDIQFAAGRPQVVKASGEALGKGAVVCETAEEAKATAHSMLVEGRLGHAGATVVIEEMLVGREVSLIAVCSGTDYVVLPSAQDYKAAYDGNLGPNTGGMGAVSPASGVGDRDLHAWAELFILPILSAFASKGTPYIGALFAGLMLTADGPKALEYNARLGDPETQAILPRLESDLGHLLRAAAAGLPLPEILVSPEESAVVVVAAAGYPGDYEKGLMLPDLAMPDGVAMFHAGTELTPEGVVSAGGRVLNAWAIAETSSAAADRVYASLSGRFGAEFRFRTDIGRA
jgi:phosphoribosylamine--glycine ligase